MNETLYLKAFCPACKAVNWICWGQLETGNVLETEAIECHLCRKAWLLDPDFWIDEKAIEIFNPDDIDDVDPTMELQEFRKTGKTPNGKTLAELIDTMANVKKGKPSP